MANTADDIKSGQLSSESVPSKKNQRSVKRKKTTKQTKDEAQKTPKKKMESELTPKTASGDTLSMSAKAVEVTRAAIANQEAAETGARAKTKAEIIPINPEVVVSDAPLASQQERIEAVAKILDESGKINDAESRAATKTFIFDDVNDVTKEDESSTLDEAQDVSADAVKVEEKSSVEAKENAEQVLQEPSSVLTKDVDVKPPFEFVSKCENSSENSGVALAAVRAAAVKSAAKKEGRWFSRLLSLAIIVIFSVVIVNFLRSGVSTPSTDLSLDHVDSYAIQDDLFDNVPVEGAQKEGTTVKVENKESATKKPIVVAGAKVESDAKARNSARVAEKIDAAAKAVTEAESQMMLAPAYLKGSEFENVEQAKTELVAGFKRGRVGLKEKESVSSLIADKSMAAGISPTLVASVVMAESYFDEKAVSRSGKKGLMQISPEREALIKQLRGGDTKAGDLFNPEYNLELGVWYLKYLLNKYDGNLQKALLAYSWNEETLQNVLDGSEKAPRWAGLYFANVQRYYNAITGSKGSRLVLSLPTAERNLPKKVSSIKVAEQKVETEQEAWEKAIMAVGQHISPQTKTEIISLIKEQSLIYAMDPAFISSIIMAESAFNPLSKSKTGKRGLFQLEPEWAKIVAATLGVTWQDDAALFEPAYNIELGVAYLQHLQLLFDDDEEKAAIAFNLTPYRVSRILAGKKRLPASAELYVKNVKKYCEQFGCSKKVATEYIERLKRVQLKK